MTEKVKIPQEVADAIEYLKGQGYPTRQIVKNALNENWCNEPEDNNIDIEIINGMDPEALVFAVHGMYGVEPEYKVGDWVLWEYENIKRIIRIDSFVADGTIVVCDGESYNVKYIKRHVTPEEIKAEKDRQLWKSIGREVGEFKKTDAGFNSDGYLVPGITALTKAYSEGDLQGFYPEESYIDLVEVEPVIKKHRVYDDRTNETLFTSESGSECASFILEKIGQNHPDFEHLFVEEVKPCNNA